LQQRELIIDLEKEIGKTKVVTTHTAKPQQGGYWCEVCECLIKDSQAYLDHINGKKHNRLLGMTMRVERVTSEQVRQRLQQLAARQRVGEKALDVVDIECRLKELRNLEENRKLRRKEKKRKRNQITDEND